MMFHENRLLAEDSHEISFLIYFQKLGKMSQNLLSAAVVIGALMVDIVMIAICSLQACEAWKKEAEDSARKMKLAEEDKQTMTKQRDEVRPGQIVAF